MHEYSIGLFHILISFWCWYVLFSKSVPVHQCNNFYNLCTPICKHIFFFCFLGIFCFMWQRAWLMELSFLLTIPIMNHCNLIFENSIKPWMYGACRISYYSEYLFASVLGAGFLSKNWRSLFHSFMICS